MNSEIKYAILPLEAKNDFDFLEKCSDLYSHHYGKWSSTSNYNPGKQIKLSPKKIREWLNNANTTMVYAQLDSDLIGYAIFVVNKYDEMPIAWVTQLVVHKDYRHQKVAERLLHAIWGFTNYKGWGIASANPYAIKALEKTTRRRVNPILIKKNKDIIMQFARQNVPFITDHTEVEIDNNLSIINTNFHVDHTDIYEMRDKVSSDETPWILGDLPEGWEWLAFTFAEQSVKALSTEEINTLMESSDDIVKSAYERMNMDNQSWAQHASSNVEYILTHSTIPDNAEIFDFGCGTGRHSIVLASKGYKVSGFDYLAKNIQECKEKIKDSEFSINFNIGDCRNIKIDHQADMILCLFDVIGTYADNSENFKILKNIFRNLKSGGTTWISVMNYDLTLHNAIFKFTMESNPDKLLDIKASNIMESTGNIFDPEYYLVDTDTHIVYRKEQFVKGTELPTETIVRDRRYTKEEIINMCKSVGFNVIEAIYVNASNWFIKRNSTEKAAKEILIKCIKP